MPVFQVLSKTTPPSGPAKQRLSRMRRRRFVGLQRIMGILIFGALANVLFRVGLDSWFFLLLPVAMSIFITPSQLSNLLQGTLLYGTLTLGLSIIYFGSIIEIQLLIHTPGFGFLSLYHGPPVSLFVVVTTTLAWALLLAPLHTFLQARIDQRFNRRNYEAARAVEAFTATLREEIDLNKVCDGLLTVAQKTMQARSVSVWVRKMVQHEGDNISARTGWAENEQMQPEENLREKQALDAETFYGTEPVEITIADEDPFITYALQHAGVAALDRLHLDSPVLQSLQANGMQVAFPLTSQGELIGLLSLGARLNEEKYARADCNLLDTLAAQVAPALRVAQLVQEQQAQVRERERIEQELRTAQNIQRTFLPKNVPSHPGWQLIPYYRPAREVGGDFYDFLMFADGRLGLVIGDVTDKGIPAALVMTATRTMLRTAAQEKSSPNEVLAQVNDLLFIDIPPSMFVTCFYAILDLKSGRLCYANAGHELPYHQQEGNATELWATGMPLGMMPGTRYEEHETFLAPGESLLLYSDGLVEAHNAAHEMFGLPRLKASLEAHPNRASLSDVLLDELQRFTGEKWEQEDDITMVVLHRAPLPLSNG
ncbi:MAG TPA: GAF domain-containing SpoIIE family protein phosphatase [Ktedonobacteraceae bacterium]|nr:GAF domain-containing SpoIIE family protein phosphatase [Ktedonobacteraceae bacterium]